MFRVIVGDGGDELDVAESAVLQSTGDDEELLYKDQDGEVRARVSMSVWEMSSEAEEGREGFNSSQIGGY